MLAAGGTIEEARSLFPAGMDERSILAIDNRLKQFIDTKEDAVVAQLNAATSEADVDRILTDLNPEAGYDMESVWKIASNNRDRITAG